MNYYKYINKSLDWGVKIASLAITGPATWVVAAHLFSDIQSPILLFIMQFAAVFLVEGVMLSNWVLLEFDKAASAEIKARYALSALTMYVAMLVIGIQHEGLTGIIFRVALLVALIGSGWDSVVYTWDKLTAKVDKSPENSGRVKGKYRRLAIKEVIKRRESDHTVTLTEIELSKQLRSEELRLQHQRAMERLQLDHNRTMAQLQHENEEYSKDLELAHRKQLQVIKERHSELPSGNRPALPAPQRGSYPYPIDEVNGDKKMKRGERLELFSNYMLAHPDMGSTALVEWAVQTFGVASSTAWEDYKKLREEVPESAVHPNGNGNGHH